MKVKIEHILLWLLIVTTVLRVPTGADSYYFYLDNVYPASTPPIATWVFQHFPPQVFFPILKLLIVGATFFVLRLRGVKTDALLYFPLIFVYLSRLEDDQLAYPLVALSLLSSPTVGIPLLLLSALVWKGALLVLLLVIVYWADKYLFKSEGIITMVWSAMVAYHFVNFNVAEQSPIFGLLLLPTLFLFNLTGYEYALVAMSTVLFPKLYFSFLPLLYWRGLRELPRWVKVVAPLATVLVIMLLPPSPYAPIDCSKETTPSVGWFWYCLAIGSR